MKVQMIHCLTTIRTLIDDDAVPAVELQLSSQIAHDREQVCQYRAVGIGRVRQTRNRLLGNHQDVSRRLRRDVAKRQTLVVFKHDVGWNLTINDFLENGLRRHGGLSDSKSDLRCKAEG